jgi:hypothetical protein
MHRTTTHVTALACAIQHSTPFLRQPLTGDHAPHARVHKLGWRGARSARGLLRSTRAKTTTHTACGLSPRRPLPCLPYSARTAYPLSNTQQPWDTTHRPNTALRALGAARPRRDLGSRALAKPSSTGDNTHHLSPSTAPMAKLTVWPGLNTPGLSRYVRRNGRYCRPRPVIPDPPPRRRPRGRTPFPTCTSTCRGRVRPDRR